MDQVTVAYIRNVLNPLETREVHHLSALKTVPEYVREICGDGIDGYEIVASVNGCEFLPGQMEQYVVAPGDSLAFCAMPKGGGSGKAIFSIVAMIAIMVVAPYVGGALAGFVAGGGGVLTAADAMLYSVGTAIAYGVGSGAVMVAGGLLMSALAPRPETPATEESKAPTYSWDNIGNSIREGSTLPELFGTCRVVPPLIGTYIDTSGDKHFMNLLFAVAGHRIDSIDVDSIRINGSPISDFAGISTEVRLGADTQPVVQNFQDSHSDQAIQLAMKSFEITGITNANPCVMTAPNHTYSVGETIYIDDVTGGMGSSINGNTYKVGGIAGNTFHLHTVGDSDVDSSGWGAYGGGGYAAKWVVGQTSGDVDEIVYGISFPKGIWYANDNGSLSSLTPEMVLQYKKHTDSVWTSCLAITTEPIVVAVPRWYCGYWSYGSWWDGNYNKFVSILTGSTNPGDHTEGEINYDYPVVVAPGSEDGSGYETTTYPNYWHWTTINEKVEEGTVLGQPEFGVPESKQSTLYYAFATGRLTRDTYDVRVRRANAFPATSRYCADATFEYLQDVLSDDLTFPGVAVFSLRALATDQLSGGMPRVDVKASRNTVWVWTGSGYEAKSASNPAWVCYHIIHRARRLDDSVTFVVEGVPHDRIDYPAFLAWADYCADSTPPVVAKTIHLYMSQTQTLRKQLNTVSLLGRGVVVQIGSKFTVLVDKLDSTVQRFSFGMGNIVKDSYVEEFIPYDDRANAVEITYYDEGRDYEPTTVELYAFDFDTSDREINKATVALYGCVDRDMALQYGKWLLNNNRLLTMVASWEAGVDAIACLPGDVVEVSHDVNLFGYSGRVESATTNTAVVDRDLTYVTNCQITVRHQDDDSLETKYISSIVGRTVNISGSWTKIPAAFANYVFSTSTTNSKKFRVLDISRESDLTYRIKGIEYDPNVYSDSVTVPPEAPPTDLKKVANLIATEVWRSDAGIGLSHVSLAWGGNAMRWNVWYRINNLTGWSWLGETPKPSFLAENLPWGYTYTFAVSGDSSNMAEGATVEITLYGKGSMPGEGLPVEVPVFDEARCSFTDKVYLTWAPVAESGIAGYEIRRGTDWASGVRMFHGNATNFVWNSYDEFPTTTTFTFHLKTFDASGLYCSGEDALTLTLAVPAAPSSVTVEASYGKIVVAWAAISDPIVVGVEVWRSNSNDRAGATLQAVIGGNSYIDVKGIGSGATYYYWLRAKTKYGSYSLWSAGDTSGHNDGPTPPIDTGDIADEAISKIKLATNLVPPEVVTSLPALPDANYPIGMIVFLTTDGKLYRNYGNVWTASVAVDDFDRMLNGQDMVVSYGPNLIANGNSELGELSYGLIPEGVGVVNEPSNAFAGQWCRKFETSYAGQQFLCTLQGSMQAVQCVEGQTFKFSFQGKCTSGGTTVGPHITFYRWNGSGWDWLQDTGQGYTATSSYQEMTHTATAPAGATFVNFYIFTVEHPSTYYFDNMVAQEVVVAEVADGSITQQKMASGLIPPRIVTSLPTLPDSEFPEGIIVYLTTDGKLYRNHNEDWISTVDVGDLDRLIEGADIAADTIAAKNIVVADFSNILLNPCFLSGGLEPWKSFGGTNSAKYKTDSGVPSGCPQDYCVELVGAYANVWQGWHDAVPGEVFAFTGDFAIGAGTDSYMSAWIHVEYQDASTGWVGFADCQIDGNSIGWTRVGGQATIPANAKRILFYVETGTGTAKGYATGMRVRRAANAMLIVDGAITADKLDAYAVTAGKIEAGAVGADAIAANVILAKHMVIADFSNMLPNPSFEGGNGSNYDYGPPAGNTTAIVTKETSGVPSRAPADYVVRLSGLNDTLVVRDWIDGIVGEVYHFSAMFAASSGTTTVFVPYLLYMLQNGSQGGVNFTNAVYAGTGQGWTVVEGMATLPADVKKFRWVIQKTNDGTANGYYTNLRLRKAVESELIVEGAVTANKMFLKSLGGSSLIQDPNMTDATAWWKDGGSFVTITDGKVGNQVYKGENSGAYSCSTLDKIPVSSEKQYRLHAWIRKHHADAGGWMAMQWLDKDYAYISEVGNDVTPSSTNVWQEFNFLSGALPSGAVYMNCYFMTWGGGGSYSEFQDCRCEEIIPANLIVDGAIQSKMLTSDQVIAGCIEAGAIGADEIASDTIVARHMVVGNFGAVNDDPDCKDATAWVTVDSQGSFTIQTISDGKAGNTVIRSASGASCYVACSKYYVVDPSKSYRLSFRARASTVSCGTLYSCLRQFKTNTGTTCDTNGGRSPYKPCSNQAAHTGWVYYSAIYSGSDFQTDCRYMKIDFLMNYTTGSGYWELQDVRLVEAVATDLIVDGSITANKIQAGSITTDKLAVVNMVANDGNYLVSTGWYLKGSYLSTRYPAATDTYFTADGRVHGYRWSGSAWVEYMSVGDTGTNVFGILSQIAGRNGLAVTVHGASADAILGACNSDATDGIGVRGVSDSSTGYGVWGESNGNVGVYGYGGSSAGYGGYFQGGSAPLRLATTGSSSPPSHTAALGSIVQDTNGNIYQNISGGSGNSAWKTIGIARTDITGYTMATGSMCLSGTGSAQRLKVMFEYYGWKTIQWV